MRKNHPKKARQTAIAAASARSVRVRGARTTVLDGPFAETKEVLAGFNPLTYLVEAERALFNGQLSDPAVWQGALAAVALAALGLTVGIRMIRRSI